MERKTPRLTGAVTRKARSATAPATPGTEAATSGGSSQPGPSASVRPGKLNL